MNAIPVAAVIAVTLATLTIGALGMRLARTTSDVFVASRAVPPWLNASAISGEYLSAASFLGIAGLVMKFGVDMLWFPVGYAAGYLILLLFVAAPLRRFGAYTIPDFAEGRLDSPAVRRVATALVLGIGWLYLMPQMKGAGLTLSVLVDTPYWAGVVVVGAVVTLNVASGGMRGITTVQAFQYWLKLVAIGLPAFVVLGHHLGTDERLADAPPVFERATTVEFDASVTFVVDEPVVVTEDGRSVRLAAGPHRVADGRELTFPAGATVPHVEGLAALDGDTWSRPFGGIAADGGHPLFAVYSLILATFLGTMGLPHILVRFYTNPDGRAARRTTLIVLLLMAAFYVFPAVFGVLGRLYAPDLYVTGETDAVVLVLPGRLIGGLGGELLSGLVAAGAFAAFLSTSSGLLISLAGALSHDVLRRSVGDFRRGALLAGAVAMGLGLLVEPFDINLLVGWAFAVAASAFCPLLVLGIWWPGLTARGAIAGLVAGGGAASGAVLASMLDVVDGGWPAVLLSRPAAWSVPLAFAVMVGVSRATAAHRPAGVGEAMLMMHTPERLGVTTGWRR